MHTNSHENDTHEMLGEKTLWDYSQTKLACTSISRSLGMSTIGASTKSSTRVLVAMIDVSVDKLCRDREWRERESQ